MSVKCSWLTDYDSRKVDLLKKSVVDGLKRVLFAVLIITANSARADLRHHELEVFDNEPPVIAELLKRAVFAERDVQNADGEWQAAKLYCEASRHGSAEAQFRLGMLYATGKGVPANRDLAASLFVVASSHGHFEAQKMLETLELTVGDLPPCVLAAVAPEKAPPKGEIDSYIANLPANKRWIVRLVDTISAWHKVDPKLVLSIISVESNFATSAQSNKQAQGLMQLIPDTAERFNVKNAYNASQNIKGGVAYLR